MHLVFTLCFFIDVLVPSMLVLLCALEAVSCIVTLPNLSPDLLHLAH